MMRFVILIFSIFAFVSGYAQSELNLYSISQVPQSLFVNPSASIHSKFHIGIGAGIDISLPVSYNEAVDQKVNQTQYINVNKLLSNLKERNLTQVSLIPDFSLGFAIKKGYVLFGVREIVDIEANIPKTLIQFINTGNADSSVLGSPQKLGGFDFQFTHYREFSAGLSYQYNCKWRLGSRLKFLMGYQNVSTQSSSIYLNTDPINYRLILTGNYQMLTSGTSTEALDRFSNSPLSTMGNLGFGIDIGAGYRPNKQLSFSAAINDVGLIHWRNFNQVIQNTDQSRVVAYSGIDLGNLSSNIESNYIENLIDSMTQKFNLEIQPYSQSYLTTLNSKIYLNSEYVLNPNATIGGTIFMKSGVSRLSPSLSLYARTTIAKKLSIQANYNLNVNTFANFGLAASITGKAAQLYMITDNLIGTFVTPKSAQNINFRFGISLGVFNHNVNHNECFDIMANQLKEAELKKELEKELEKNEPEPEPIPIVDTIVDTTTIRYDHYRNERTPSPLDPDDDMVTETRDYCPQHKGTSLFEGCPNEALYNLLKLHQYVLFPNGKNKLYPKYARLLDQYIRQLIQKRNTRLSLIVRMTSQESLANPNLALERAEYLTEYIKRYGIDSKRIIVIVYGKNNPIKEPNILDEIINSSAEVKLIGE